MMTPCRSVELRTANPADRVALRGVHVRALLRGMSQRTTVEQTFVNLENRAIEAVYTFPLPESAAVCGFEVITSDRVLTGKIDESDRAIETYEQAIEAGNGAFILEQDRPDVFTVRVGNLKPHQAATIRLVYVCPLDRADGSIRVAFPTTIAPRYATSTGRDPIDAVLDADALNPPHVLFVPYGLSLEVDVDLGAALNGVSSPSHAINITNIEKDTIRVTLSGGVTEMDRDVVLLIEPKVQQLPRVQVSRGKEGESYLAVSFIPEFDEDALATAVAGETVFVLDCSGSMQGESLAQATAALELCLRSLSAGDTFNICRFGSRWEMMRSEPVQYTQSALDTAIRYVRASRDLGGTELHAPLAAILGTAPAVGTIRQIVLLTDGQVTNEPAIIELARKHRQHNRIFSFGIGPASSAFLVRGLARATGGGAEFITAGERIEDKVLRTFSRIASPPVTDIAIDWDGCDVQTLAELPPIFDGDVLGVFARAPGRVPRQVTLRCLTPAGPRQWTVAVPPPQEDAGLIATMWARRSIQSLEEVNHVSTARDNTTLKSRDQLLRLSREFNLLCSLTSFVAVEHRSIEERNDGRPAVRRIPLKLAQGWGGMVAAAAGGVLCASTAKRGFEGARRRIRTAGAAPVPEAKFSRLCEQDLGAVLKAAPAQDPGSSAYAARVNPPADDLLALLAQQAADGSFVQGEIIHRLLKETTQTTGVDLRQLIESRLPRAVQPADRAAVLITTLVLLLLSSRFADRQPTWRRAYRKACRSFLAPRTGQTPAALEAWLRELPCAANKDQPTAR